MGIFKNNEFIITSTTRPGRIHVYSSVYAHERAVNCIAVSIDGILVATGSQDKIVWIWSLPSLTSFSKLQGHRKAITDLKFSPVDKVIVSSSNDQTICIWSVHLAFCLRIFQLNTTTVLKVRFLNNGSEIMFSGKDGTLKIWTKRKNHFVYSRKVHNHKIWALSSSGESNNEKLVVSG